MTFVQAIQSICEQKMIPKELQEVFLGFCSDYEKACLDQGIAPDTLIETFTTFLSGVSKHLAHPHQFAPYHKQERAPTDYYKLGLDFVRPLVDLARSSVLGNEVLQEIADAVLRKENVILFSNHQTEIDPQIISILIEKEHPDLAETMLFVAGHRVTTDPLAVPLSRGRNLICIYSKRHVETPPEKKSEKLAHNQKALKCLQECLTQGGQCIYIAPSGGRDRRRVSGEIDVAPFDPDSIELFYLISKKAKNKTHFYTLSLDTYALLPPPDEILKTIGEKRTTRFCPAHLAFGKKIDMDRVVDTRFADDKKKMRQMRSEVIYKQVLDNYKKIQ